MQRIVTAIRNNFKLTGGRAPAAAGSALTKDRQTLQDALSKLGADVQADEAVSTSSSAVPSAAEQRKLVDMKRFSDVMRARGLPADACAMIKSITPYSITQDTISDCSFVASLCIASAFERRFKKQLITRIIYPQVLHSDRHAMLSQLITQII